MARNIAPGYCVVNRPGPLDYQARELFRDTRSPATQLFMKLNADTRYLRPGQILIVADPDTPPRLTMHMLNTLRQAKNKTNAAFIGVNSDDAGFMHRHYGLIAALTGAGDKIFSTAGDVGERYFRAIEQTLKKIEVSYQNQFRTQGTLIGQQFFVERNQLLSQLKELVNKPLLKSLARYTVKFRQYENLKRALNLSSKSIVHEWSTAGLGGIPGYSYYVGNAARAARFLKMGGYIGIGFSFAGVTNDVVEACTIGRESECGKIAVRRYSKFALGTGAGMYGGAWGGSAALAGCAAIGIMTAGVGGVACAVVGSLAGGYIGSKAGEKAVDFLLGSTGD
ncbi:membrane protein [Erwinia mallotivora]|uniref:Membrane protein n=2 Tax=Erwinia mallotivora TaxID=69222 RepID=A0A014NMX4_9GAMM|nr:membrane protein [Erwinia mallotivora]EXU75180.1 membrane protein [Erwinia mallotivora]